MSKRFIILFLCISFLIVDKALSMECKRKEEEEKETEKVEQKPAKLIKIEEEEISEPIEYSSMSNLPDEIKLKIIRDYLISSPHWKKIKNVNDIEKFIKRRSLAHVDKKFRELILDPSLKLALIRKFVKENREEATFQLIEASKSGNVELIKNLVKAGASVKGLNPTENPLIELIKNPIIDILNKEKLVLMLLKAGADPSFEVLFNMPVKEDIGLVTGYGYRTISYTPTIDTYNIGLKHAIDLNYSNIVKYLLDFGANPFMFIAQWNNFLSKASKDVKELLLNHPYTKVLFKLIGHQNRFGQQISNEFLQAWAQISKLPNFDINAQDKDGYTLLMLIILFFPPGYLIKTIEYLLKLKADPTIRNKEGETASDFAKWRDDLSEGTKQYINLLLTSERIRNQ